MRIASTTLVEEEQMLVVSIISISHVAANICVITAEVAMRLVEATLVDNCNVLVVTIAGIVDVNARCRLHPCLLRAIAGTVDVAANIHQRRPRQARNARCQHHSRR